MCRSEACSLPVAAVLPADMPFPRPRVQPMKPKLPRKLATSARINLNKYWHALEELMPVSCRAFDESDSNAINENLDNERKLAAMRLSESQGVGRPGSPRGSAVPVLNSLGKNTLLPTPAASANVLQDSQRSSSSSSPMNIDGSSGSSRTCNFDSTSTGSSYILPPFSSEGYPDENTPPNGSSIIS